MILREEVLKVLKDHQGEWVSGEALSKNLNVSRTAVWKHIKTLLEQGYQIQSSTRKGYRLCTPADLLSPEEVKPGLMTKVFGQDKYIYYRQTDSTNKRARALAMEGYPEGTVIVAEEQTDGKGRRGRSWYSPSIREYICQSFCGQLFRSGKSPGFPASCRSFG
jgi:BirA family biotin operon repressor/biotin-[acetyl-CoA-carboxylase] ligase